MGSTPSPAATSMLRKKRSANGMPRVGINAGRNKAVELRRNDRKSEKERRKQRHLHIGKKCFGRPREDEPAVRPLHRIGQRDCEKFIDFLLEIKTDHKSGGEPPETAQQARAQLDQMLDGRAPWGSEFAL